MTLQFLFAVPAIGRVFEVALLLFDIITMNILFIIVLFLSLGIGIGLQLKVL